MITRKFELSNDHANVISFVLVLINTLVVCPPVKVGIYRIGVSVQGKKV